MGQVITIPVPMKRQSQFGSEIPSNARCLYNMHSSVRLNHPLRNFELFPFFDTLT